MSTDDLRRKRQQLVADAGRILERAEDEGRDMTREESRKFDQLHKRAQQLAYKIELGHTRFTQPISGRPDPDPGQEYAAPADDAEPRALGPEESAVSHLERRGVLTEDDHYDGLTLGGYLRAALLGPETDVERRALAEGSGPSGGFTVPTVLSAELIDRLRPQSHVLRAGARIVPLGSDEYTFARLASDPTPGWRGEEGSVTESDATFEAITFRPKSVAFLVKASRELLQDSKNLNEALPRVFSRTMAQELDRVALLGDGASEPQGLLGASGVSEEVMGTNGDSIGDFNPFIAIRRKILEANAPEPRNVIYSPRTGEAVELLKDGSGQPLERPPALREWTFRETSKIPNDMTQGTANNASAAFVGNFSSLWIGERLDVEVEPLRERYADNLQVGFLVFARWDTNFEHAGALGRILGIIPA